MSIKKYIRKNILSLAPYSTARDEFQSDKKINSYLDANENPYNNGINRYPDPYQSELKQEICVLKGVKPERIFLGNGSDEAIDILFRVFCEPRVDNIITIKPSYGMYKVTAAINDIKCTEVALSEDFHLNINDIFSKIDENTKMVFLCSPNNPSGNLLKKSDILELIEKFDGIVVVDEAYIDFASDGGYREYLDKYENLVILQTFSKAWGMAGLRLGMAFANEDIIEVMTRVKYPYNINILAQSRALEEIRNNKEKIEAELSEVVQQREMVEAKMSEFSFITKIFPSDANFLLIECKMADELYKFLIDEGEILVRNRTNVPGCKNCLRITIGTPSENLDLLSKLKEYEKSIVY